MIVDRCCWNPCFLSLGHNFSRRRTYTHTPEVVPPWFIWAFVRCRSLAVYICARAAHRGCMVARIRGALSRKQHLMELPPLLLLPWRGIKIYVRYGGDLSGFTARWSCPLSPRTKGRTRTKSSQRGQLNLNKNLFLIAYRRAHALSQQIDKQQKIMLLVWIRARKVLPECCATFNDHFYFKLIIQGYLFRGDSLWEWARLSI